MQELWTPAEEPSLQVTAGNDWRMSVDVRDEAGAIVQQAVPVLENGVCRLSRLPEGGYTAHVSAKAKDGPSPIVKPFLVLANEAEPVSPGTVNHA
jgi:hypothetical protein